MKQRRQFAHDKPRVPLPLKHWLAARFSRSTRSRSKYDPATEDRKHAEQRKGAA